MVSKTSLQTSAQRARELATIGRTLDRGKNELAYGEFERWALDQFPAFPIQVLRYLRKAHRTFGKDLVRLLARYGQKKVFLLVGLENPWAPVHDGIPWGVNGSRVALEKLSVNQLRHAIRHQNGRAAPRVGDGWGNLSTTFTRINALWPRVQKLPVGVALTRDGARRQLERFRTLLGEVVGHLDALLSKPGGGRANGARRELRAARAPRPRREPGFLD